MREEETEENVLRPFNEIICNFDANQKIEWSRWSGQLPKRVVKISNEQMKSNGRVDQLQNLVYMFVVVSAAIPIILAILINTLGWSNLASLIDAVFPAVVGVTQTNLSNWQKKRLVFASVYSPYYRLLADAIIDIHNNVYSSNSQIYINKWEELDKILVNAGLTV